MRRATLELARRLFSQPEAETASPGVLSFCCNICGTSNCLFARDINREGGACRVCGSIMRFRSLAAVLTQRLFGKIDVLDNIEPRNDIRGVGMSDHEFYSVRLAKKFDYTNTYFHCEPLLDVMNLSDRWVGVSDFIVSSDVFEHVAPPVQRAFDNLYRMLKPGGVVVFSVPFLLQDQTYEHFPNLFDYTIREAEPGKWILRNVTRDGSIEEFDNLVFHGGPGTTLEMRLFSLAALEQHFIAAGFKEFRVHGEAEYEYGIFWPEPWSITISAVRAKT
jgi:SAM-dependent methyltransferase